MSIPANNVSIGLPTKKSHYDALYDNAILADTGGTPGGAQTIPGHKTFSSGLNSVIRKTITSSYTLLDNDHLTEIWSDATATQTVTLPTVLDNIERTVSVYNINSGKVIIVGEGGELIRGTTTVTLKNQYDHVSLESIGTEWIVSRGPAGFNDDDWHLIGGSGEPAFQNSWVNAGGNNTVLRFKKDILGFVHVEGRIKDGTVGNIIFTLPSGYQSDEALLFTSVGDGAFAWGYTLGNSSGDLYHGGGSNVSFAFTFIFEAFT